MSNKFSQLKDAFLAADKDLSDVKSKRRERESQLLEGVRKTIDVEFSEAIVSAYKKVAEAKQAMDEEESRIAKERTDHPYPLGTVMCKWRVVGRWSGVKEKTGKEGIFEIVTNDTQFPKNIRYKKTIGSYIVRILKKDGTPSLKIDTSWSWRWEPKDESIKRKGEGF